MIKISRAVFLMLLMVFGFRSFSQAYSIKHISEKEFDKVITDLIKTDTGLRAQVNLSFNPADLKAKNKSLKNDMAILYYYFSKTSLYIFCANSDSVFGKKVNIEGDELRKKVALHYKLISHPDFDVGMQRCAKSTDTFKIADHEKIRIETSRELYEILINPIIKEMGSKPHLAITRSSDLMLIPFCALIKNETDGENTYLLNNFREFYISNLDFLKSQGENSETGSMATLWCISDAGTQVLMSKFYENMRKEPDNMEALLKARVYLSRLQGFTHPYYWAPFVYMR